ncbi:outer membrane beta-barrel protein [Fibrivirga algicola]|jgi:hypothetical protein|uniref:PorT family protein n=1 Tax=Fibrivirga algicola TaxID=2950420 RepID=A0ABX0QN97_9BACT|nr:outer membrane beta-barrel protein [Fibrivirga algicola]NID13621.1 PorT family protein [Fibrivirga algicola]
MSDERFDRLMKKNLESVRPAYQPSAWNRFRKRLPLGFWSRLLPYGGWVLSALMLTGWLTTLYTLHENQQVIRQLTKTLAVRTDTGTVTPALPIPPALTHRVDTVYVVQRTVVEHRYGREPKAEPLSSVDRVTGQVRPATDQADRRLTLPERQVDSTHLNVPSAESHPMAITRSTHSERPESGQVSRGNQTERKLLVKPGENTPILSNKTRQATPSSEKESVTDSVNRVIAQATATIPVDSNQTQRDKSMLVKVDSATQKPANPPITPTTPVAQPDKQSRPPFRLSSLQPRVGIETGATLNGVGVGPAIEIFPTENLGVSLGVQASQLQLEEHKELRDFNAATGTEFIEQYRAFLPAQYDQIRDISVRTSLVSLPVYLKYYIPLRRNWSLLVQTGTSFDVAAYQQVRYESYYRGDEQFHSFDVDTQPRFFHNFIFGAGLQYRRPRISAQVSPYYIYDFRSITNTPAGSNVGIKASVWLDLFK